LANKRIHRQKLKSLLDYLYSKYPEIKWVVHHKDGNKQNNKFENLEIMPKEKHDRIHGLFIQGKTWNKGVKFKKREKTKRQIKQAENKKFREKSLFDWTKKYYKEHEGHIPWVRIWECYFRFPGVKKISFDFFEGPYSSRLVFNLIKNELNFLGYNM
jgi:HNH endonuclease